MKNLIKVLLFKNQDHKLHYLHSSLPIAACLMSLFFSFEYSFFLIHVELQDVEDKYALKEV